MSDEEIPLLERVASYYSQLSTVAADLNAVSDELGKSVSEIDFALKKLNLGITTWVPIHGDEGNGHDGDYSFWSRDIGYAKVGGKWGISLRKVDGDYLEPDEATIEEWPFNEAPRSLRLEAIDKIPELLETLSKDAVKTTKDIRARLSEAQAVAEAVKGAANSPARSPHRIPASTLNTIMRQAKAPEAPAPASDTPSLDSMRHAIGSALVDAGHSSAAQLLGAGAWTLDGASLRIEVPGMGKKLLALTVNAAAEKIIRQELQRLGAPTRFLVVPGEAMIQDAASSSSPGPVADSSKGVQG
jgi:hypothetical protein